MKVCTGCGHEKPLEDFNRDKRKSDGRGSRCKDCRRSYFQRHYAENTERAKEVMRRHREANRERVKEQGRSYHERHRERILPKQRAAGKARRAEAKETVMAHYGGKCVCCGETEPVFLTLDHIEGGGTAHRKEVRAGHFYFHVIKEGFPEGYQILCWNCNWGKHILGACPHSKVG